MTTYAPQELTEHGRLGLLICVLDIFLLTYLLTECSH